MQCNVALIQYKKIEMYAVLASLCTFFSLFLWIQHFSQEILQMKCFLRKKRGARERERERVFLCYFCKVTSLEIHTVQCSLVVYLATHVGLVYKCKCFIGSFQPSWRAVILTKDILTKILEQWCFLGIVVVLCILFVFCIRFKTSQNQISFSFCLKLWILMTLTL